VKRRALLGGIAATLLGGCAGVGPAPGDAYVFAYFIGNGEDGLHLAGSRDGYRWDALGNGRSFLRPEVGAAKLMRDPCILRGPDGIYRMVWTSGWNDTGIGYAASPDLVHWSPQRLLPVMAHEPGALNAWAPEIAWDERRGEYVIFWSSTIPGRFAATDGAGDGTGAARYNHRIYATTTRDFVTFAPTRLFYDPGFSVIDATLLRTPRGDWLLVKDETRHPPRKVLQLARAVGPQGPFEPPGAPITPPGLWTEGPTALQVGADVVVYYDAYTAKHYGALRSRDLVHWEDVTDRMRFPDEGTARRMRHGTALRVPAALLAALEGAAKTP